MAVLNMGTPLTDSGESETFEKTADLSGFEDGE
jgi:hypothetical protein